MKRFEYLEEVNPTLNKLNDLGFNRWELVSVVVSNISSKFVYIFKRKLI